MALGRGVPGVPGLGRGAEAGVRRPSRGAAAGVCHPLCSATCPCPRAWVPGPGLGWGWQRCDEQIQVRATNRAFELQELSRRGATQGGFLDGVAPSQPWAGRGQLSQSFSCSWEHRVEILLGPRGWGGSGGSDGALLEARAGLYLALIEKSNFLFSPKVPCSFLGPHKALWAIAFPGIFLF